MIETRSSNVSALAFHTPDRIDLAEPMQALSDMLENIGFRVERLDAVSETSFQLQTDHYSLRVTEQTNQTLSGVTGTFGQTLSVHLVRRVGAVQHRSFVPYDVTLRCVLHCLQDEVRADYIQIQGQKECLTAAEFAGDTETIPRLVAAMQEAGEQMSHPEFAATPAQRPAEAPAVAQSPVFATTPDEQFALFDKLRDVLEEAPRDTHDLAEDTSTLRLAAWFMSISVGLLCLPLGVMLTIINLLRGENLRLASQTAALTGTFVALQTMGSTAQAADAIQTLLF